MITNSHLGPIDLELVNEFSRDLWGNKSRVTNYQINEEFGHLYLSYKDGELFQADISDFCKWLLIKNRDIKIDKILE